MSRVVSSASFEGHCHFERLGRQHGAAPDTPLASKACYDCAKLELLLATKEACALCGGSNGEVLSPERVREGIEKGTYRGSNEKPTNKH